MIKIEESVQNENSRSEKLVQYTIATKEQNDLINALTILQMTFYSGNCIWNYQHVIFHDF